MILRLSLKNAPDLLVAHLSHPGSLNRNGAAAQHDNSLPLRKGCVSTVVTSLTALYPSDILPLTLL